MTQLPTKTLVNRARVEDFLGDTAHGPTWDSPKENVRCRLDATERVAVQRGSDVQVVGRAVMYVRRADRMPTLSRIHIDGQRYEAIEVQPITGAFRIAGYRVVLG